MTSERRAALPAWHVSLTRDDQVTIHNAFPDRGSGREAQFDRPSGRVAVGAERRVHPPNAPASLHTTRSCPPSTGAARRWGVPTLKRRLGAIARRRKRRFSADRPSGRVAVGAERRVYPPNAPASLHTTRSCPPSTGAARRCRSPSAACGSHHVFGAGAGRWLPCVLQDVGLAMARRRARPSGRDTHHEEDRVRVAGSSPRSAAQGWVSSPEGRYPRRRSNRTSNLGATARPLRSLHGRIIATS
jgi:hypothetical protein